ncbi:MAG: hypothetical protein ACREMN_09770 [Gemmatimonadales bacterium]
MKTSFLVVLVIVPLAGAACRPSPGDTVPMTGRPTPAPPATLTNPRDPAQRRAAVRYADGLIFAEDTGRSHAFHGQFDRNLLDTLGTIGTVAPEIGMHHSRVADLQRGRIQLRVRIQPGAGYLAGFAPGRYGRAPGQHYRFPPGVSYVWVDSLYLFATARGDTAGTAKIVVIPRDTAFVVDTASILVFRREPMNQAVARWSPAQCWDCMRASWCSLSLR